MMISSGLGIIYHPWKDLSNTSLNDLLANLLLAFFAIVGFGLILSIYRFGSWLGMAYSITIFAISIQFNPLLQSLFYTIFLKPSVEPFGRTYLFQSQSSNVSQFFDHYIFGEL